MVAPPIQPPVRSVSFYPNAGKLWGRAIIELLVSAYLAFRVVRRHTSGIALHNPITTNTLDVIVMLFVVFGVLWALASIMLAARKVPIIKADQRGLSVALLKVGLIPWNQIADVAPMMVGAFRYLAIFPVNIEAMAQGKSRAVVRAMKRNYQKHGVALLISDSHINVRPPEAAAALRQLLAASRSGQAVPAAPPIRL